MKVCDSATTQRFTLCQLIAKTLCASRVLILTLFDATNVHQTALVLQPNAIHKS